MSCFTFDFVSFVVMICIIQWFSGLNAVVQYTWLMIVLWTMITVTLVLSIMRKGSNNVMKFIGTATIWLPKKKKKKNRVYISCITYPSNTKGESEYVNTYCLITLLLFILDVINKTLVLVQLHNMYEHIWTYMNIIHSLYYLQ